MLSASQLNFATLLLLFHATCSLCFVCSPRWPVRSAKRTSFARCSSRPQLRHLPTHTSLRDCMMGQSTGQQENSAAKQSSEWKEIKGVLFDIDGTLFDSDPVHFDVFAELLGKEGIVCDEHFFRTKIAGRQNKVIMADLFPDWSIEKAEAWSEVKEQQFREQAPGKLKPTPGLIELMDWIDAKGLKKAAVTNAPRDNAELMLKSIGRLDWFDTIIIGDECERSKPDPFPYQLAMKRLGLEPSGSMVIEDSPSGARAGVASGAFTVGILTSQPAAALTAEGCPLLIKDFADEGLWRVLDKERK